MTHTKVVCQCGWGVTVGPNVNQIISCARCFSRLSIDTTMPRSGAESCFRQDRRDEIDWTALHQYPIDQRLDWGFERAENWLATWASENASGGSSSHRLLHAVLEAQPALLDTAKVFFTWAVSCHNQFNRSLGRPTLPLLDFERRYRFPSERGLVQPLITWEDFTRDTLLLSQVIIDSLPEVSGIAGCPRSGMRAASEIALRLDLPLYEASAEHGLRRCSAGGRFQKADVHGARRSGVNHQIAIVDDSTCSGTAIRELRLHPDLDDLPVFVVYAGAEGRNLVDGFAVNLDLPHWFDWNFFNNGQLLSLYNVGIDWDGVLNEDCPAEYDDDGACYRRWLESLKPIRLPRGFKVPYIVTARREAYRLESEQWLQRYGINYGHLIMFPGSFQERRLTDVGQWKAEVCRSVGIGLFVESCSRQAARIADLCEIPVLCTESTGVG